MCTWAGYIGEKRAAPILLEMAKRQEGLWSGFYSGLVTLSGGRLCWDKVVGNMAKLEAETAAGSFPGNVGLVHSRTKSGGGREWAHPFVSSEETVADVAQGCEGFFKNHTGRTDVGNELLALGRSFRSAIPGEMQNYPTLRDGSAVHTTEVVAEAVAGEYERRREPREAIRRTMIRIPSEGVFAFLVHDRPDYIYAANVNQRMVIGKDEDGVYLATSALAFPESVRWRAEMPGNTIAVMTRNTCSFESLGPTETFPVEEMMPANLDQAFLDFVRANPASTLAKVVDNALAPILQRDRLVRRSAAGYQAMERLLAGGVMRAETQTVPGVEEDDTAPQTVFFCCK